MFNSIVYMNRVMISSAGHRDGICLCLRVSV